MSSPDEKPPTFSACDDGTRLELASKTSATPPGRAPSRTCPRGCQAVSSRSTSRPRPDRPGEGCRDPGAAAGETTTWRSSPGPPMGTKLSHHFELKHYNEPKNLWWNDSIQLLKFLIQKNDTLQLISWFAMKDKLGTAHEGISGNESLKNLVAQP